MANPLSSDPAAAEATKPESIGDIANPAEHMLRHMLRKGKARWDMAGRHFQRSGTPLPRLGKHINLFSKCEKRTARRSCEAGPGAGHALTDFYFALLSFAVLWFAFGDFFILQPWMFLVILSPPNYKNRNKKRLMPFSLVGLRGSYLSASRSTPFLKANPIKKMWCFVDLDLPQNIYSDLHVTISFLLQTSNP